MAWQTTPLGLLVLAVAALLTIGAASRLTRLFNEDTITQPLRVWLDGKAADTWYAADESKPDKLTHAVPAKRRWRWAAKLARCPWCLGFWVSALLVAAYFRVLLDTWPGTDAPHAFVYLVAVFAVSQIVGLAAEWLDSPPPIRQVQVLPAHVTVRQDPPTT